MKKITSLLAAAAAALSLTFTGISAAAVDHVDYTTQEEASVIYEDNGAQVEVQQLLLAETETPVEVENTAPEEENSNDFVKKLLISLAVGVIIAFIVCFIMKSMMKTANPKATANDYIRKNSFNITRSRDIFIYAKVTKKKREKQENK